MKDWHSSNPTTSWFVVVSLGETLNPKLHRHRAWKTLYTLRQLPSLNHYFVTFLNILNREQREAAMSNVRDAKRVLDQWKTSYFEMRAEIEESGSYSRWEFDRRKLFERTDYMASICQDLNHVLQVSVSVSLHWDLLGGKAFKVLIVLHRLWKSLEISLVQTLKLSRATLIRLRKSCAELTTCVYPLRTLFLILLTSTK